MKKAALHAIVITAMITAYPAVSKAMMLGTCDFVGSGGSSRFLTELEFRIEPGFGYIGPLFEISWIAGPEHVGDTIFVSAETDAYFEIVAYFLSNGAYDHIWMCGGHGCSGSTDCSFFTKVPGVETEYCDFHGCNITAISLTVNALTLEHPTYTRTDYSYDVTFTIWGDPPVPTPPTTYYVDADASGANDGSSWANAYNYLHDALLAASRGDEIWVAQGIYKPDQGGGMIPGDQTATFQPINGITIKGGYAGFGEPDTNARDIKVYETILSGDLNGDDGPHCANNGENSYRVVTEIGTDETAMLDGFTITGGSAHGMYNFFSSPTLTNCTFSKNSTKWGGGMFNYQSSPTLTNCTFSSNSAENGGGMYNRRSNPTLDNCMFTANSSTSEGAGIYNYRNSSPILTNCTFAANSAANGNALAFDSPQHRKYPSTLKMTNCILWDGGNEIWNNDNSTITIAYSDIQGGWPGEGNIDADPCFVEPGYWDANGVWVDGDYRLLPDSPCIDAGDPNYVVEPNETDLDGKHRVIGCRIDMGAYEYGQLVPAEVNIVPRTINLASKGKWITCYIWLPEGYDVADIDLCYLLLEYEIEPEQLWVDEEKQVVTARFSREKVQTILNTGEVELTISLHLTDGTYFEGTCIITVVDKAGGRPDKYVQASNPNPADGATGVSTTADLSWTAGSDATLHDVYFGTSNPPPFIRNQTSTTFDPGTMAYYTTYYWRIDEVNKWSKTTGTVWSFTTSWGGGPSDARLKTDIKTLTNVLDKVEKIRGVSFEWSAVADSIGISDGRRQIGVIAQDVEAVFPELVGTSKGIYKGVEYHKLTAVLIEAVKELKAENENLKRRIEVLEKRSPAE